MKIDFRAKGVLIRWWLNRWRKKRNCMEMIINVAGKKNMANYTRMLVWICVVIMVHFNFEEKWTERVAFVELGDANLIAIAFAEQWISLTNQHYITRQTNKIIKLPYYFINPTRIKKYFFLTKKKFKKQKIKEKKIGITWLHSIKSCSIKVFSWNFFFRFSLKVILVL